MSTDLHRQKYRKPFERLDADNSGTIEETDIDALVQFWCNIFKVQPGSTKWRWINDSAHKMWRYLLEYIDADGNQQVNHKRGLMIDSKKLKNFTLYSVATVMLSAAGEDVLAHTVIRNVIST